MQHLLTHDSERSSAAIGTAAHAHDIKCMRTPYCCGNVDHKASVPCQTPFGTLLGSLALLAVAIFIRSAKDSRNWLGSTFRHIRMSESSALDLSSCSFVPWTTTHDASRHAMKGCKWHDVDMLPRHREFGFPAFECSKNCFWECSQSCCATCQSRISACHLQSELCSIAACALWPHCWS